MANIIAVMLVQVGTLMERVVVIQVAIATRLKLKQFLQKEPAGAKTSGFFH